MQEHHDPLVQAEATACLQQLHMFAPRHVNLSSLVPTLCKTLSSSHLLLRRAAVACLRQLAQREAKEVCEHALTLIPETQARIGGTGSCKDSLGSGPVLTDSGLPGVLFGMLDTETDRQLVSDIHDTLTSMLQALAEDHLSHWLGLCKDVLTSSADVSGSPGSGTKDGEVGENEVDVSDESHFHAREEAITHPTIFPRWPTKVFAAESVCRIITACEGNRTHFDLMLAREMQSTTKSADFLVLHLSDLVRMAFMAATSDSDQLRLEGLRTLQLIIDKFAKVPEPEFPGHVILEQYQAQVGAALRPAFSPDTPSHVTAMACQVCSAWIGSEVARDLNDLRRVHQLLVSSLAKLKKGSTSSQLYNESTATLEKLAILKAWAEVYIVAMIQEESKLSSMPEQESLSPQEENADEVSIGSKESLLDLVKPELPSLSKNWLAALRDHAILSLSPEFANQQRHDGGAFYNTDIMDSARVHYRNSWTPILHAAALWLNSGGFEEADPESGVENPAPDLSNGCGSQDRRTPEEIHSDRFHLIFGICMEALCSPRSTEPLECVVVCLQALYKLLESPWARGNIGNDPQLAIELCNVLHRLLLTRENPQAQLKVMDVVQRVVLASQESLTARKKKKLKEIAPANQEPKTPDETAVLGEGGEIGEIIPGKSVVFALLEVCLCVLVRHLPSLNPSLPNGAASSINIVSHLKVAPLTREGSSLVATALSVMSELPGLCSPAGSIAILPTILFLTTGVLRETSTKSLTDPVLQCSKASSEPVTVALHSLKQLVSNPFTKDPRCSTEWKVLLQSALAKILDISKTSTDIVKVDEVNMLLGVAVFILSAPPDVIRVPNLQYPCINLYKQALESEDLQVRIKTVQTLKSIFQHPDRSVAIPYIHALACRIIELITNSETKKPTTDLQLFFTLECLQIIEIVVLLADPQHRIHMLSLAMPIFVKLLIDPEELESASTWTRAVHDHVLQRLMVIGPQYRQEFRTIMGVVPQLRSKLETSIRAHQDASHRNAGTNMSSQSRNNPSSSTISGTHTPSIKLKTDFSNFTG